jgi:hypothetical protein
MVNVDKKFTYIQEENFGNKKKITSTLLRNYAENDTYLEDQVNQLWDSTDPENRVHFKPISINPNESYGVILDAAQNNFKFSNQTSYTINTTFKNHTNIDEIKTTAYIDTSTGRVTIPPLKKEINTTTECQGPWPRRYRFM